MRQNILSSPITQIIASSTSVVFVLFVLGTFLYVPSYKSDTDTVDNVSNENNNNQPSELITANHLISESFDNFHQGKYNETITTLNTVIDQYGAKISQSRLAVAYALRGDTKAEIGDHAGALKDLQQAAVLKPMDKLIWGDLAGRYGKLGFKTKAIESFEKAISLDPNNLIEPKNEELKRDELEFK